MKVRQRVYVMSPYSGGDQAINVRVALEIAERIIQVGGIPFVPHLFHFWHFFKPQPKTYWMTIDKEMIRACHCIVCNRATFLSDGMIEETEFNETFLKLKVYFLREIYKPGFVFEEVED